ncbi:beta-lactamase-like protein 2 homolog [Condylostylus longicornis]|uniref:beta-lactamase-like protein 2 homolog n=1 Tax=Condylostylus longicornis TaxID=2530218 RepID=UPI00244DEC35|nr:beta-lactamase-like protein 2 homolog [Condylostylus longicornis]XP_055387392.1 beta-lactamase-like protein 2 homolog [Condylostylus longicornis]XP_055387394.1 beta-lactamase-like protein 2 homolog [Condylostylus longicornis]
MSLIKLRSIPDVTKISQHIIRVLGCNPSAMTLQGTNTYLIGTGKERILIDAGDANVPKYVQLLKRVLKEEDAKIKDIILTHWHHDHIGGVKDILRDEKCRVWKYERSDADDEILPNIAIKKLNNGQIFKVEGAVLKVVHTPGHTTDHVVLTLQDGSLFSGDCVLGEGTAVFEDLYEYMKSLKTILDLNPKVIYPGHGNIIENPIEKLNYYIEHRNQREKQIIDVFETNAKKTFTDRMIVEIIYENLPENLKLAAAFNVNHHLMKLAKCGLIKQITGGGENLWILVEKGELSKSTL